MPDFRNLGVLLRILVATSLLSVVAAVLLSPRLDRFGWTLLDVCATVQPPLVLVLITLAAACPMLDRLRYPVAAGGVIALSAIAAGASHAFGSMLLGAAGSDPGRHALLGMAWPPRSWAGWTCAAGRCRPRSWRHGCRPCRRGSDRTSSSTA